MAGFGGADEFPIPSIIYNASLLQLILSILHKRKECESHDEMVFDPVGGRRGTGHFRIRRNHRSDSGNFQGSVLGLPGSVRNLAVLRPGALNALTRFNRLLHPRKAESVRKASRDLETALPGRFFNFPLSFFNFYFKGSFPTSKKPFSPSIIIIATLRAFA